MQEALLKQYIDSLKQRIGRIDSLLEKLQEGNSKADENIRLLAHSLHGSGASFGFPEISEAAKTVEYADAASLTETLEALKAVLETVVANAGTGAKPAPVENQDARPGKQDAVAQDTTKQQAVDKAPAPGRKGLDILVVDDDPDIIDKITNALESLPGKKNITVARTGAKAQEAIVNQHFDLTIMDLVLPDRDGRDLIREIKLEFKLNSPLVVLSAIKNDNVRVECMSLGADKFLTKPFYADDLVREARKLLYDKNKQKLTLVPMDGEAVVGLPADIDEKPSYLKGRSILVVEDDKMQAELISQRLSGEGASIKQAGNGREAMQLLRTQEFSLVILDVKMPVMDGFEVLERIRGELGLGVPVIMVTAMGSEKDIIRGYDLGVTDYILKPFSEVLLVARVKSLLKPADE